MIGMRFQGKAHEDEGQKVSVGRKSFTLRHKENELIYDESSKKNNKMISMEKGSRWESSVAIGNGERVIQCITKYNHDNGLWDIYLYAIDFTGKQLMARDGTTVSMPVSSGNLKLFRVGETHEPAVPYFRLNEQDGSHTLVFGGREITLGLLA